jgi:hypothetical protein
MRSEIVRLDRHVARLEIRDAALRDTLDRMLRLVGDRQAESRE